MGSNASTKGTAKQKKPAVKTAARKEVKKLKEVKKASAKKEAKKTSARKEDKKTPKKEVKKTALKKETAKTSQRKETVQKASQRKEMAKKTQPAESAKKSSHKAESAKKSSQKKEPAKKASQKKEPEKKASQKKEPAKKASQKKEPAKKASQKKEPAKKASQRKEPEKKASQRKESAKKAPVESTPPATDCTKVASSAIRPWQKETRLSMQSTAVPSVASLSTRSVATSRGGLSSKAPADSHAQLSRCKRPISLKAITDLPLAQTKRRKTGADADVKPECSTASVSQELDLSPKRGQRLVADTILETPKSKLRTIRRQPSTPLATLEDDDSVVCYTPRTPLKAVKEERLRIPSDGSPERVRPEVEVKHEDDEVMQKNCCTPPIELKNKEERMMRIWGPSGVPPVPRQKTAGRRVQCPDSPIAPRALFGDDDENQDEHFGCNSMLISPPRVSRERHFINLFGPTGIPGAPLRSTNVRDFESTWWAEC